MPRNRDRREINNKIIQQYFELDRAISRKFFRVPSKLMRVLLIFSFVVQDLCDMRLMKILGSDEYVFRAGDHLEQQKPTLENIENMHVLVHARTLYFAGGDKCYTVGQLAQDIIARVTEVKFDKKREVGYKGNRDVMEMLNLGIDSKFKEKSVAETNTNKDLLLPHDKEIGFKKNKNIFNMFKTKEDVESEYKKAMGLKENKNISDVFKTNKNLEAENKKKVGFTQNKNVIDVFKTNKNLEAENKKEVGFTQNKNVIDVFKTNKNLESENKKEVGFTQNKNVIDVFKTNKNLEAENKKEVGFTQNKNVIDVFKTNKNLEVENKKAVGFKENRKVLDLFNLGVDSKNGQDEHDKRNKGGFVQPPIKKVAEENSRTHRSGHENIASARNGEGKHPGNSLGEHGNFNGSEKSNQGQNRPQRSNLGDNGQRRQGSDPRGRGQMSSRNGQPLNPGMSPHNAGPNNKMGLRPNGRINKNNIGDDDPMKNDMNGNDGYNRNQNNYGPQSMNSPGDYLGNNDENIYECPTDEYDAFVENLGYDGNNQNDYGPTQPENYPQRHDQFVNGDQNRNSRSENDQFNEQRNKVRRAGVGNGISRSQNDDILDPDEGRRVKKNRNQDEDFNDNLGGNSVKNKKNHNQDYEYDDNIAENNRPVKNRKNRYQDDDFDENNVPMRKNNRKMHDDLDDNEDYPPSGRIGEEKNRNKNQENERQKQQKIHNQSNLRTHPNSKFEDDDLNAEKYHKTPQKKHLFESDSSMENEKKDGFIAKDVMIDEIDIDFFHLVLKNNKEPGNICITLFEKKFIFAPCSVTNDNQKFTLVREDEVLKEIRNAMILEKNARELAEKQKELEKEREKSNLFDPKKEALKNEIKTVDSKPKKSAETGTLFNPKNLNHSLEDEEVNQNMSSQYTTPNQSNIPPRITLDENKNQQEKNSLTSIPPVKLKEGPRDYYIPPIALKNNKSQPPENNVFRTVLKTDLPNQPNQPKKPLAIRVETIGNVDTANSIKLPSENKTEVINIGVPNNNDQTEKKITIETKNTRNDAEEQITLPISSAKKDDLGIDQMLNDDSLLDENDDFFSKLQRSFSLKDFDINNI